MKTDCTADLSSCALACSLLSLCFSEISLVHATFAVQFAKLRCDCRCSCSATVTSSPNVSTRIWQIWGPWPTKLLSSVLSCLCFTNTRCLLAHWITTHTTVGMFRLLSAAAVAWSSSHVMSVIVCSYPSDQLAICDSVRAGSRSLLVLSRLANDAKPNEVLDRTRQ